MKEIVLEPGQKALFNKSNNQINVSQENDFELYIAWTKGWFLFSKANIITIFNKLERYYNVKFFYDDSYNLDDLISGKLDLKDSISNVMVILSDLVKFSFKIDNDNIYIEKN